MRSGTRGKLAGLGVLAALAIGVLTVGHAPSADALDKDTQALVDLCEARVSIHRQRIAIGKLADKGTGDSRKALNRLAGSDNDQLAALALGALCRDGSTAAHKTVKGVLEDTKRSEFVRCAALGAHCQIVKDGGDGWNDAKGYVNARASGKRALDDMADSLAKKLWKVKRKTGGSDE